MGCLFSKTAELAQDNPLSKSESSLMPSTHHIRPRDPYWIVAMSSRGLPPILLQWAAVALGQVLLERGLHLPFVADTRQRIHLPGGRSWHRTDPGTRKLQVIDRAQSRSPFFAALKVPKSGVDGGGTGFKQRTVGCLAKPTPLPPRICRRDSRAGQGGDSACWKDHRAFSPATQRIIRAKKPHSSAFDAEEGL